MSDPTPDPVDQAYREAESVLSDEAARAARRERVLAAVAQQGAPHASAPGASRGLWRRGRWLVAASVAAFGAFMAAELYRPFPPPAAPPTAQRRAPLGIATPPAASAKAPSAAPLQAIAAPPKVTTGPALPTASDRPLALREAAAKAPAPAGRAFPADGAALASPPPSLPAPPERAPAAASSAAPEPAADQAATAASGSDSQGAVSELVVAGQRRETRSQSVPVAVSVFSGAQREVVGINPRSENLLAAAAAGRTDEVEALLAQGAAVDSVDSNGDTPLMKSIEGDHPDTAAVLWRHGASLRHKNHAGRTAKDLAVEQGDPALEKALGVRP